MTLRQDPVGSIEGFYVASILDQLHRLGILGALGRGASAAALATAFKVDATVLGGLLDYVAQRSGHVRCVGSGDRRRFALSQPADGFANHLLDQYVGAFGPCLANLSQILKAPDAGAQFVDRRRHADAFAEGGPAPELIGLIEALQLDCMLDIGCGGGQLLTALAQAQPNFRGVGLDANRNMIALARRRATQLGLADRLQFRHGEVDRLDSAVSRAARERLAGISAVSVANAFFARPELIDRFFARLKAHLPGRILVLCDYYSRLGSRQSGNADVRRTLIHDVAQLVSSQGLPPADLKGWRRIYARNSVKLLHAQTAQDEGVSWFIHVLKL